MIGLGTARKVDATDRLEHHVERTLPCRRGGEFLLIDDGATLSIVMRLAALQGLRILSACPDEHGSRLFIYRPPAGAL